MSAGDRDQRSSSALWSPGVPRWLRSLGTISWLAVGIAGAAAIVAWLFSQLAGVLIPLILACAIGVVAYPLVERMERVRIPRRLGAVITLLLLAAIIVLVVWIVVYGVVAKWPQIQGSIQQGIGSAKSSLDSLGVSQQTLAVWAGRLESVAKGGSQGVVSGVASSASSLLSGIGGGLLGVLIGAVVLYYLLSEYPRVVDYVSCHLGMPAELGEGVMDDVSASLRGYFRGTTITAAAVAAFIGVGVWVLGVPLAVPIAVVTFLTSYIPFFGAIVAGAFAFLIALGTKGFTSALLVLAVVLVAQNILQTLVNPKAMGESLSIHPIVVLIATVLGGIFAGLLGAMFAAPMTAALVRAGHRIRAYARRDDRSEAGAGVERSLT